MDDKQAILAMLDKRIEEAERLYREADNDETALYLQGCWEEAQRIAGSIRGLGQTPPR